MIINEKYLHTNNTQSSVEDPENKKLGFLTNRTLKLKINERNSCNSVALLVLCFISKKIFKKLHVLMK